MLLPFSMCIILCALPWRGHCHSWIEVAERRPGPVCLRHCPLEGRSYIRTVITYPRYLCGAILLLIHNVLDVRVDWMLSLQARHALARPHIHEDCYIITRLSVSQCDCCLVMGVAASPTRDTNSIVAPVVLLYCCSRT